MRGTWQYRYLLRVLALVGLFWPAGCAQKARVAGTNSAGIPIVRVRLLESQSEVTLNSSESVAFREAPGVSPRPLSVARKQDLVISRLPSGWRVGNVNIDA